MQVISISSYWKYIQSAHQVSVMSPGPHEKTINVSHNNKKKYLKAGLDSAKICNCSGVIFTFSLFVCYGKSQVFLEIACPTWVIRPSLVCKTNYGTFYDDGLNEKITLLIWLIWSFIYSPITKYIVYIGGLAILWDRIKGLATLRQATS